MAKHEIKEIHVICNTHWDREFRETFQLTRMKLVEMMDGLIDVLEKNPDYHSYMLDSQSIVVEDYLEVRPENKSRLMDLMKAGRVQIGPWYTLPDVPNIEGEALVRNMLFGKKVAESLGTETMKVGYTPFSWGQTGQLPQIYREIGIDTALFYRGISLHEAPAFFLWEGVDGSELLTCRFGLLARYNYYYLVHRPVFYGQDPLDRAWKLGARDEFSFKMVDRPEEVTNVELPDPNIDYDPDRIQAAVDKMLELEGEHYTEVTPYFLGMHGHDISGAHELDSKLIKDAAEKKVTPKLVQNDLAGYFEKVKSEIDYESLVRLKGERRSPLKVGWWTYLLPATISARTYLKVMDYTTTQALTRCAEPLAVMAANLGMEYPRNYLELAWKYLLGNHTHDANAGCSLDAVHEDMEYRYRQAKDIAEGVTVSAMRHISSMINTGEDRNRTSLVVFNTLPKTRSQVIHAAVDLPREWSSESLQLFDPDGQSLPIQVISIEDKFCFVDTQYDIPKMYDTVRYNLLVPAYNVPGLGYKSLYIKPHHKKEKNQQNIAKGENVLENGYMKVEVNYNGTLNITDKKSGMYYSGIGYLIDQGEAGNAWRHAAPEADKIYDSQEAKATVTVEETGQLRGRLRVDYEIRVPLESDEKGRSEDLINIPVSLYLTLTNDSPFLDCRIAVENTAADHWLRMVFPTDLDSDTVRADSHFDVVERNIPLPDSTGWKEEWVGTYPMRSFVDISDGNMGLAVITEGLFEYEAMRDDRNSIAVSILRSLRIKLEVSETHKEIIKDPGPLCLGRREFRFAIYPHKGAWRDADLPFISQSFSMPMRACQIGNSKGDMPAGWGMLEISPRSLVYSAVKQSEDGKSIVLRLFNPTDEAVKGKISFQGDIQSAFLMNLDEKDGEKLEITENNEIPVSCPPKKILTLGIKRPETMI